MISPTDRSRGSRVDCILTQRNQTLIRLTKWSLIEANNPTLHCQSCFLPQISEIVSVAEIVAN